MLALTIRSVVLLTTTAFFAAPIIWLMTASIMERRDIFRNPPEMGFVPTAANLVEVFVTGDGLGQLLTTLLVSGASAVLATAIAFAQAANFVLTRKDPKKLEASLLAFYAVPGAVIAVPFFLYVSAIGIPGPVAFVAGTTATAAMIAVLLILGYARGVKRSAIETLALLSPQSVWRRFPMFISEMRSVIGVVATFAFLVGWHDLIIGVVTSGAGFRSLNVAIIGLVTPIGTYWGQIAALSVPSVALALALTFSVNTTFLRGFAFGR